MGDVIAFGARHARPRAARPAAPPAPSAEVAPPIVPDDSDFYRGMEIGALMLALSTRPAAWTGTFRTSNVPMVRRVAQDRGYTVTVSRTPNEAWAYIKLMHNPPERAAG